VSSARAERLVNLVFHHLAENGLHPVLGETGDPADDFVRQERFTPFTAIYNVTGQPAVTVPMHWSGGDPTLPIGVMLAGRPADEATLISLSAQLEDAVPWVDRHPPGW